jgi:hypothetical protein
MRWLLALILSVCLALMGLLGAHQLSYAIVAGASAGHHHHAGDGQSVPHEHAHSTSDLLAETGHGYLEQAPFAILVLVGVALVVLLLEGISSRRRGALMTARPGRLALLGPAAFVAQEHIERWAHSGHFPWDAALEPTFVVGLALQLPAALLALGLARRLLRAARRVAAALFGPSAFVPRTRDGASRIPPPRAVPRPDGPRLLSAAAGRAPPLSSSC